MLSICFCMLVGFVNCVCKILYAVLTERKCLDTVAHY